MLKFDPMDPFPLLPEERHDYAAEQAHAARVDQWLGLATAEVEQEVGVTPGQQNWAGLPIQALMTPYTELRFILEQLKPRPGEAVVDLGAAYGRMGFVMARHFPQARFIGFELDRSRVAEGKRCWESCRTLKPGLAQGLETSFRLEVADLERSDFRLPPAEYFFIYDYGTRKAIEKTLDDLRLLAQTQPLTVVGRGRRVRDMIERAQPWLSQVAEPEHFDHFSIYRSIEKRPLDS